MAKQPSWSQDEIDIITSLYKTTSLKDLVALLPRRTIAAVSLKARDLGLKRDLSQAHRKHDVNFGYFSEPNLENCYWAGFIAADGCISEKQFRVRVKLSDTDTDHLLRLQRDVGHSGVLYYGPNKHKRYAALELKGMKQWVEDLEKHFNITPRKSLTLAPPDHLPLDLALAFITGYIDGDGCIREEDFIHRKKLRLSIVGTKSMCSWIKHTLDGLFPSAYDAQVLSFKKVYTWAVSGRHGEAMLAMLNQIDVPKLARKWSKIPV